MASFRIARASTVAVVSLSSLVCFRENKTKGGDSSYTMLDSDEGSYRVAENVLQESLQDMQGFLSKQFKNMKVMEGDTKVQAAVAARFMDVLSRSAVVLLDYKLHKMMDASDEEWIKVHERAAESMYKACASHGGLLVKLGQHISSTGFGNIPKEYIEALTPLQDSCNQLPFEVIYKNIESELRKLYGPQCSPKDIFREIDSQPLGSASLAQVHAATLHDGRRVALKVQRPDLGSATYADLIAIQILSRVVERIFPGSGFEWMITIIAELDFNQEARNAERCTNMLRGFALSTGTSLFGWLQQSRQPETIVPTIVHDLTTEKLLTMTFEEGFRLDDTKEMKRHGIDPQKVSAALCSLFGELMFVHGFVYVDCHPGNILVKPRTDSRGEFDIVLLDHGMYRRLEEDFRAGCCDLYAGLLDGDDEQALKGLQQLGIEDKYLDLMGVALVQRIPPNMLRASISGIGQGGLKFAVKEHFRHKFGDDFTTPAGLNDFVQAQSRDFLYTSRCSNLLKGLNESLGGTRTARLDAFGSAASRGSKLNTGNMSIDQSGAHRITSDLLSVAKAELNLPVMSELVATSRVTDTVEDELSDIQVNLVQEQPVHRQAWWRDAMLDLSLFRIDCAQEISGKETGARMRVKEVTSS